jgi:hypothetical protein
MRARVALTSSEVLGFAMGAFSCKSPTKEELNAVRLGATLSSCRHQASRC